MEAVLSPFGINLYGGLARAFKKKFDYEPRNIPIKVNSVQEIMRAMEANFPGFKQLIRKKGYYKVVKGEDVVSDNGLNAEELKLQFKENIWHLFPIAAGSKGGALQIVLGAVLLIVGIVMMVYAPVGAPAWYGIMAEGLVMIGGSMVLGGIAQMLTPMPKIPESGMAGGEPSYLFNGAINQVEPGIAVPIAYGETWIGGIPISFGVDVTDIITVTPVNQVTTADPPTYQAPGEPVWNSGWNSPGGDGAAGGGDGAAGGGDGGGDGCGPGGGDCG